jgi:hypothetical protein
MRLTRDSGRQFGWDMEPITQVYLRQLEDAFPPEKRYALAGRFTSFPWISSIMLSHNATLLFAKTEWLSNTQEDINFLMDKYGPTTA